MSETVLTSWAKAIRKALDASGCNSASLFQAAGLDIGLLADPDARYPLPATTRLWKLAVEATGDAAFGLKVASQVTPGTFHAVGQTLLTSATLKDAFKRAIRYSRIVTDLGGLALQEQGDELQLVFLDSPASPPPAHEALDAFISIQVRMSRALLGREVSPLRIEMRRPTPADLPSFEHTLRAPLIFNAKRNLIAFDRQIAERPLDGDNPLLAKHYDDIAQRVLSSLEKNNVLLKVRTELIKRLPEGEPAQEDIAAAVNLSTRGLQRKLAEQDATYKGLLDSTRLALALSYLDQGSYSITEVAYLLGFAETSSFTRAFRRWTGRSPSAYLKGPDFR